MLALLFNTLARFAIAFLPRSKRLLISWLTKHGPLKKEMANHFSILALRIPWAEVPGGTLVHGVAKSQT